MTYSAGCVDPAVCATGTVGNSPSLDIKGTSSFNNNSTANGVRRVTLQTSLQQHRIAAGPAASINEHEATAQFALCIFSRSHPVRKAAVYVVTNRYFEWFILTMILLNCVELAMYSHQPGFETTALAHVLDTAEYVFLFVFGTEMMLKVIAMGLIMERGTYLRNGWNVLDATVVALGVVDAAVTGPSYSALRAVRVLRPLRTITHVKGLRVPVVTLLHALPQLVDVGILCGFALLIFGIVGVQMFAGVLRNRCAAADFTSAVSVPSRSDGSNLVYHNVSYLLPLDSTQTCSGYHAAELTWSPAGQGSNSSDPAWSGGSPGGGYVCPTVPDLAAAAPYGLFCAAFDNPNSGMTSFDNVLWAWITIFQCITTEGWTDIMYSVWDAVSPVSLVYFVALLIFGSFFLINLALAVLYLQFTKEFSITPAVSRSISFAADNLDKKEQQLLSEDSEFQPEARQYKLQLSVEYEHTADGRQGPMGLAARAENTKHAERFGSETPAKVDSAQGYEVLSENSNQQATADNKAGRTTEAVSTDITPDTPTLNEAADCVTAHVIVSNRIPATATPDNKQLHAVKSSRKKEGYCESVIACEGEGKQQANGCTAWATCRRICRQCVQHGWFSLLNILVILANTAVMATVSYPMDSSWAVASERLNVAFSIYFALELLLKMIGLGVKGALRDRMSQFDALVVVASLVEIALMLTLGADVLTSLSVLRTARLMRVFKLARSWQELNRIISTILRSFSQVIYLSLLMLLFVFVFALMGMQLFGYAFGRCAVSGAQQLCPPGVDRCSAYPDCYVRCNADEVFQWFPVPGSPYNHQAYCEQFPRNGSTWGDVDAARAADASAMPGTFQYLAQVGQAQVPDSNFDNIGSAALTVFQLVTTENWNNVMYNGMVKLSPAISLWFIAAIIIGNYILLNLFLAILLENFSATGPSEGSGSGGLRTASSGSTLAAAAQMAVVHDWLHELLRCSWYAKLLHKNNKVHTLSGRKVLSGNWTAAGAVDSSCITPTPCIEAPGDVAASPTPRRGSECAASLGADAAVFSSHRCGSQHASGISADVSSTAQSSHRFSLLKAPAKTPNNILTSLIATRAASFAVTSSATSMPKLPGQTSAADALKPCLNVARSSQSMFMLRGNIKSPSAACTSSRASGDFHDWQASTQRSHGNVSAYHVPQQVKAASMVNLLVAQSPEADMGAQRLDEEPATADRPGSSSQGTASSRQPSLEGKSLAMFGPQNWLRVKLNALAHHPHFENTILLLIVLSSLTLTLEMPSLDHKSLMYKFLQALDNVFVVLFALEAMIKVLVKGFIFNGPESYLRNAWNVLDFIIVVIGVVVMSLTLGGGDVHALSSLRALRTLRALRPLRVASRLEGMKVVVNALFASLPPLGNVLLVCLLFYLVFGIMAVHLLAGMLYSCQDQQGNLYDASHVLAAGQQVTRAWCEDDTVQVNTSAYHASINVSLPAYTPNKRWVNRVANFDNVLGAVLTLFQISTTELWVNTMYDSVAAVGVDKQPRNGANPALAVFFVVFIIFGGFFVLQLFVATTIEKFADMQQQQKRSILLTARQQEWLEIQRMMADVKPQAQHAAPKNSSWRRAIFRLVMSQYCEFFVIVVIIANVLILMMTHADMNDSWHAFMSCSNIVFTAIFTLEALLKIVAIGILPYVKDRWCQFDLFVVAISIAGVAVDMTTAQDLEFLPLLRVMRVARVFKLIPKAQGLRTLLQTLVFSLPALGNVGSVLFLFFFIYAVVGMNLFGAVKHGVYLSDKVNFSNVAIGLLTLFRCITGESWNGIMQDCMISTGCMEVLQDVLLPPGVVSPTNSSVLAAGTWLDPGDSLLAHLPSGAVVDRCSPGGLVAVIYFCSFVMLCGLVMVNFVIGVIIDNMQSSKTHDDMTVSRYHLEHFVRVWSELDPRATHYIPAVELSTLIQELPPPLGVKGEEGHRAKIQTIVLSIEIPVRNTKVHFLETLHALAGRVAGTEEPEVEEHKIHQKMYSNLPPNNPADPPKYTAAHFYAALYVQAAVRGFLRRHALLGGRSDDGASRTPQGHP